MMSGRSFWVDHRENLKRRSWTYLLCMLATFLAMPIWQAMELSAMQQRMEADPYYHGYGQPQEKLREAFLEAVTYDGTILFLILIFAVLFAVQGFSWLDSRRKLDLYLSVPVSAAGRFRAIYLNGVGMFASCYLAALLLTLLVGTGMGIASGKVAVCALAAFLSNMIFFLAVYNLTLIAVMMTGKILVGLLAAGVFFFYEYAVRQLFDSMRSIFFSTYCNMSDISSQVWTSPVFTWSSEGGMYMKGYGDRHLFSFLGTLGLVASQAVVYGFLAYRLYRKRGAQAAGHAMAFPRSKGVVKILLMVPFTFLVGLWFRQLSEASTFFTFLGMAIGLLLAHGLIQIIYDGDIRSIWKKKWHILAAGAVSGVIFAVFYYDLAGYDDWIPESSRVKEVAFCLENERYGTDYYEELFTEDMYYRDSCEYMMEHMASREAAAREAVRELARRDREMRADRSGHGAGYASAMIKYVLDDGRTVYRSVWIEAAASADQMDVLFADRAFQTARYQIGDPLFEAHAQELEVYYSNGLEEESFLGDTADLVRTIARDLGKCSFSLTQEGFPVGKLSFRYHIPGEAEHVFHVWDYPVYDTFEDTIGLLKEQDAYLELTREGSYIAPEKVASVTLTCYNQEEDLRSDGDRSVSYYEEDRMVSETFTDAGQIARILPALYPESLEDISGRIGTDTGFWNYDVSVVLKPGVRIGPPNGTQYNPFRVDAGKLPGFAREKVRYAE